MSDQRDGSSKSQLRRAASAEKRLVKDEAAAEKRLRKAKTRLERAEEKLSRARGRVERRSRDVAEAAAELRARQAARAAGPDQGAALTAPTAAKGEHPNGAQDSTDQTQPEADAAEPAKQDIG